MFRFFAEILLRSAIEKDNTANKKRFLPWDKIEKIALIIGKNETVNKSVLDKLITDTHKFVEVFYVDIHSKEAAYSDWHCFTKKDASFLKLPKGPVKEDLNKKKFDLVVNTASDNDLFATAICTTLQATFKCGNSAKYNNIGLIIEKKEPHSLPAYLAETVRYLKMIRV